MIRGRWKRFLARKGAVAVTAAIGAVPLAALTALVVDGSLMMAERRKVQAAADAAAFAAVCAWSKATSGTDAQSAAYNAAYAYAASNGYNNDGVNSTVTPSTTGQPGCIQVVVASTRRKFFSAGLVGPNSITARSVAKWSAPSTLFVLDPSSSSSLSVAGGGMLTVAGSIQVNSTSGQAVNVNNYGSIQSADLLTLVDLSVLLDVFNVANLFFRATVKVAGDAVKSGGGQIYVPVLKNSVVVADPLATSIYTPTTAGLTTRTVPAGWQLNFINYPLYPGVYSSGMNLSAGGMSYKLQPGTYYLTNGDFSVSNGVGVIGDEVTIYLANGNVSLQGGSSVTLSAPTSGAYQGVVLHQKAPADSSTTRTIAFANGSINSLNGIVYAPAANFSLAGGTITDQSLLGLFNKAPAAMIVRKLAVSNNARLVLNGTVGNPSYYLVE